MQVRLYDLLSDNPEPVQREETRTTEEVADSIIAGMSEILGAEPAQAIPFGRGNDTVRA